MGVPPSPTTIPTSFVPKQPVRPSSAYKKGGGNTFLFVSFIVLGVVLLSVVGVFVFERFLISTRDAKSKEVTQAQERISTATVEEFIRTRNRFIAAETLLDSHVAATGFFNVLELLTLTSVRFNSLSLKLAEDRSAEIHMEGVARTFNALAAQSSAFASEKRIRSAIFSDISVGEKNNVSFTLTADLAPELIVYAVAPITAVEQPAGPKDTSAATSNEPVTSPEEMKPEASPPTP